jgi:RimJ/RimL family protein N-acetyltransferase
LDDGVVRLRPWRVEEADWYVAQAADPEIQRFTTEPPDLDPAAVRAAIEDMLASRAYAGLVITDAVTGQLLGNAGLAPGPEAGVGEVSYWVAAGARGRAVATRAVRLMVALAWECGMHRVQLHARADNAGSQRVAERAGFRRERTEPAARVVKGESWDIVWYGVERPAGADQSVRGLTTFRRAMRQPAAVRTRASS